MCIRDSPISAGDGTVIIPVSKVGFGFASGGSDFTTKAHQPPNKPEDANLCFGGGSGAGVTINPVAFLVVNSKGEVSLIPMDQSEASTLDRVIDKMPTIIEKTKEAFSKKKDKEYTDLGD